MPGRSRRRKEKAAIVAIGKEKFAEWLPTILTRFPAWLLDYRTETADMDDVYYRMGQKGWGWSYPFVFDIPGLARISYDLDREYWVSVVAWQYDTEEPTFISASGARTSKDLDAILLEARHQFIKYDKLMEDWNASIEQRKADQAERERQEQEAQEREALRTQVRQEREGKQRAEEAVLLDAIQNDPIMLVFLKAMVMIRDEKREFVDQLNDAYEAANFREERYQERLIQYRDRADEAERQAADERRRLEGERDEAEKKLKKAERGW